MTDNEIVKSLESLLDRMRAYESLQASIGKGLVENIISMYNRQKAEIERLQNHIKNTFENLTKQCVEHEIKTVKSEAYREFAERLCKDRVSNDPVVIAVKVELKELTEK